MRPREFLDLADELTIGSTEAEWRSAASRAYYAAFHVACELLRELGFSVPESESAHQYLVFRLNNAGALQLSATAGQLRDLRRERNVADYDLRALYSNHTGAAQVRIAAEVIEVLESYLVEPARFPDLAAAIAAYERDVLREVTFRAAGGES